MITILTTVYNGWEFLEECASSIFLQQCEYGATLPPFQWEWWIGVNGHGEDGGPAMAAALRAAASRPNVHVVNMPSVKGRVAALNELRRLAAPTDWVAILDCDDVWEKDKLLTQMLAVAMAPAAKPDIIGTFCSYFGDKVSSGPVLPPGWISPEQIARANPIINSSVLMRADIAFWEDRYGLEDYDLWIRASAAGRRLFNVPHPLVRHRIHAKSAFNGKGSQDMEGLRAYHGLIAKPPTVVSAYYPVPSKYPTADYIKWISDFWPHMQCNLVFYTDTALVEMFQKLFAGRPRTLVVGVPFRSLTAFQKLSPQVWAETYLLDKEKGVHTPELYALWYEKKEFVLRTIAANPFGSTEFVWCDAGIGRFPEWIPNIQGFPTSGVIPKGRMLLLEIDPFKPEDCVADEHGIPGRFENSATFGGGILASDVAGWNRWSKAYDAMLLRYYLADRFIGKDQNIMASMVLECPELAVLIKRPASLGPLHGWFYLLFFLAGIRIL